MRARIIYKTGFEIPKNLPHGMSTDHVGDDIFRDHLMTLDDHLVLFSRCGQTRFGKWENKDDHYVIPNGIEGGYIGARNALNSVWGIQFPECEVRDIESTIGRFHTLEDYDAARTLVLPVMRNVERFLRVRREASDRGSEDLSSVQAGKWLARLKESLVFVVDDLGNAIHSDA